MIDAPTNEIAIGRKISALANASTLGLVDRGWRRCSPMAVATNGAIEHPDHVLRRTMSWSRSVKIVL